MVYRYLFRSTHGMQVHLQNGQVEFAYQGQRVKVKVTEAKYLSVYSICGWSAFD